MINVQFLHFNVILLIPWSQTASINTSRVKEKLRIFLVLRSGGKSDGPPLVHFDLWTMLMKILCKRLDEHKLVDLIVPLRSSSPQTFHKTISCRHEIGDSRAGKAKQASMKKHKANRCGDKEPEKRRTNRRLHVLTCIGASWIRSRFN